MPAPRTNNPNLNEFIVKQVQEKNGDDGEG